MEAVVTLGRSPATVQGPGAVEMDNRCWSMDGCRMAEGMRQLLRQPLLLRLRSSCVMGETGSTCRCTDDTAGDLGSGSQSMGQ